MLKSPSVSPGAYGRPHNVRGDILRYLQNGVGQVPSDVAQSNPSPPPSTTVTDDDFAAWIAAT